MILEKEMIINPNNNAHPGDRSRRFIGMKGSVVKSP